MTINNAIQIFLIDQFHKGNSPKTIKSYDMCLHKFSAFLDNKNIDALTIKDVNNYHVHLSQTDVSSVTIKTYLVHVRAFLNYLFQEKYLNENIINKMRIPKTAKKLLRILSDDEVRTIIDSFDHSTFIGIRNVAIILLMLDCGLRKGEVEGLKLSNVNFDKGYLIVNGKGNKERIVPIGVTSRITIIRYAKKRKALCSPSDSFMLKKTGEPLGKETIKDMFRDLKSITQISRVHSHLLRHTYATNFLLNGLGDIYELSRLLGHSELQTTQVYVNIANNYIMMEKKNKRTYIDILYSKQ